MQNDVPKDIQVERDERKKIAGATVVEQERWREKNVGETMEKLDELGQEDEKKGREAVQKAYKEYQDEEFAKKSDRIAWLNQKAKFSAGRRSEYIHHVHTVVQYEISYLELPPGYAFRSEVTAEGIKFVLTDRFGGVHIGGFAPSGLGLYDEQACRTSVNKIDDLISQLESNPKNGLYLP